MSDTTSNENDTSSNAVNPLMPSETIRLTYLAEDTGETVDLKDESEAQLKLGVRIGAGGVGEVFEAVQPSLRRTVAVKVLQPSRKDAFSQMFVNEAHITARLNHPNILPVHDMVQVGGVPALVMKRIHGQSWDALIEEERRNDTFTVERHVRILINVCRAVSYAHAQGIVHLDIKPANVMVGEFGETLLMDWGCAAVYEDSLWSDLPTVPRARAIRHPLGTPAFLPPEQARGDGASISPASDVFLLGATLYTLLTTSPLRRGKTTDRILEEAASLSNLPTVTSGPAELIGLVHRTLAHDPMDRVASATAVQRDLEAWLDGREARALVRDAERMLRGIESSETPKENQSQALVQALALFEQAAKTKDVRDRATAGAVRTRSALARAALESEEPGLARAFATPMPADNAARAEILAAAEVLSQTQAKGRRALRAIKILSAISAVALITLSIFSTRMYLSSEQALRDLTVSSAETEALQQFSAKMLHSIDPDFAQGKDTALIEHVLEQAKKDVFVQFSGQPVPLSTAAIQISSGYYGLGRYDEATDLLLEAKAVLESTTPRPEYALAKIHSGLSDTLRSKGDFAGAIEYGRTAAATFKDLGETKAEALALGQLVRAHISDGVKEEHVAIINRAIELHRQSDGEINIDTLAALEARSLVFMSLNRLDLATPDSKRILEARCRLEGEDSMTCSTSHLNHGILLRRQLKTRDSIFHYREALRIREPIVDAMHPRMLTLKNNIGAAYKYFGAWSEAIRYLGEAYNGRKANLEKGHPYTRLTGVMLLESLVGSGRLDEAEALYQELPPPAPQPATAIDCIHRRSIAQLLLAQGKPQDALRMLSPLDRDALDVDPAFWVSIEVFEAHARFAAGQPVDIDGLVKETLPQQVEALGVGNCDLMGRAAKIIQVVAGSGRGEEARRLQEDLATRTRATLAEPDHQLLTEVTEACLAKFEAISLP